MDAETKSRRFRTGPDPIDARARRFALVFVLVVVAIRVAALAVNRTDLYFDEAQYWTWAQAPDFGYYSKPPLIAFVIAATTGVFGDAEWAVRLAAPLLHGATALVLMVLGDRLYGGRTGAVAAVLYMLLPAVSLSSMLISTDVPLLLAWAAGLVFAERLLRRDDMGSALGLGLAIAVGLNAKYAMAFLPAVLILALAADPALRSMLRSPRLLAAMAIGLAGFLPNLVWNVRNRFVTFAHTGDNASWTGQLKPDSVLEFVGSQFGVFGPLLFLALLMAAAGRWRSDRPQADRFLLMTSLPILLVFVGQALLSRANANWGATAYPAATVLVAALVAAPGRRWVLKGSVALHGLVAVLLVVGPALAPVLRLPLAGRPFERLLGWSDFAGAVVELAGVTGARTIVVGRRADAASLAYYLRDSGLAVVVPGPGEGLPRDHYQMTRPFTPDLPGPGLLVLPESDGVPAGLGWTESGPAITIPVGRGVLKREPMVARPIGW